MPDRAGENNLLFQHLLQTTQEGYWHIDNDTLTIDVNPAMCRILGLPKEEIIGRSIFEFVDETNTATFHHEIEARKSGKLGSYEIALRRPDGTNVPCLNNATPVLNSRGEKVASIGLWTDISEIKNVQNLLVDAKEEAETANNAKSDFLSSISHELRTPLHALLGFAELLATDQERALDEVQQKYVDRILRSGDHLLNLIDTVLDLTRIERGNISLAIENFAPDAVIARSLEIAQPLANRNGITLTDRTVGQQFPAIRGDQTRLQQVLINLLANAIKYNRKDGAASLACEPTPDGMMRFTVSDTGSGISQQDQEQLFAPFHRLGMEKGSIEGAGIGLAVSRSLVEKMDGKLTFNSELGKGSKFFVDLPIAPADAPDCAESEPDTRVAKNLQAPSQIQSAVRMVLYIEDNPDLIQLMENILNREPDMDMISAHNAETGLFLAEEVVPDIILMDINLPGMNGLDALRKLRNGPLTCGIPVVAVSGAAMQHDVEGGIAAGFCAYLTKPFRMREVVATINEALPGN
ncbi:MAG: response regulator [Alphaproteobacteria bacterium]|nr:response regulator [Alphaproteobacteria bacterium]